MKIQICYQDKIESKYHEYSTKHYRFLVAWNDKQYGLFCVDWKEQAQDVLSLQKVVLVHYQGILLYAIFQSIF